MLIFIIINTISLLIYSNIILSYQICAKFSISEILPLLCLYRACVIEKSEARLDTWEFLFYFNN